MTEIVTAVAGRIVAYLVAPITLPFSYLWNYKSNFDNLKEQVKMLEGRRDSVQLLVKVGEEPLPNVKIWQDKVKKVIDEASELINEDNLEQANIQFCKGFSCPNLMKRYHLSKKAAGKLKSGVQLEQEAAQFKEVSSRTILEETWLQSSESYEAFESRTSVSKNIIDALCKPDVNVVGIYGMGGIGKTTLAKKVASQAKQDNLFDEIIFVEVSKTPDIQNIQEEIGEKLGLEFHEKTVNGRARALFQQLKKEVTISRGADNREEKKKEKKILLILDNIWERIGLETVGIPLGGDCKGLKLLLTTRRSDVLTNQMDSQCNFSIDALNEEDAWTLFKSIVGTSVDHPDLKSIAPEVAKKCGGIPIAIVTIAKALKDKGQNEWKNALRELKNPSSESFEGITKEVYTSIKLSYDYLQNELQEIFLLCSRMGRTYKASIQDLFRYAFGLGLFEKIDKMEDALCKLYVSINKLKATSLLLDAPNESKESADYGTADDSDWFAMHDVVCDVAISIASRKGDVCIVIAEVIPKSWANKNKLKNCTSITLHNMCKLPKDLRLVCPQLKFFYMKTKDSFSRIPDDFFTEMSVLHVLHLIDFNLSPLPTSLSYLVNLQTLCLDECKLGDIAVIGKMEKLEILSFHGSKIEKLPEEMHQLTSIRLLDLTNCSTLEIIHPIVISCFTQLEALYMYNTSIKWEVGELNIGRRNAGLDELKRLRDGLTTLEICIPDARMSEGLLSSQLERYKISIGFDPEWKYPPKNSRTLRFKIKTNDNADGVISQLKGIKELELFGENMYDSRHSVSSDALLSLESLVLKDLNLEKICNGPLLADSFGQLTTIRVDKCNKLTNIFSFSTDRVLPKLQKIKVSSCQNMEDIFAIEREDDFNSTQVIHEIQFSQLRSVTLADLPRFKSFCHRVNTEDKIDIPKSLFNDEMKVVFPNLQNLKISGINLPLIMSSCVQNLIKLNVSDCHNLKEICSSSTVITEESREEDMRDTRELCFPNLQELVVSRCQSLKYLFAASNNVANNDYSPKFLFPKLTSLRLWKLPELRSFYPGRHTVEGPILKRLQLWDCGIHDIDEEGQMQMQQLLFFVEQAFPCLEDLTLAGKNVMMMWQGQVPESLFVKLKILEVFFDDSTCLPLCIIQKFQNREELSLAYSSYKEIFSNGEDQTQSATPPRIKTLYLWRLEDLKYMWKPDFNLDLILQNLEVLYIWRCNGLINVMPPSSSFKNLTVMKVGECSSLINIGTSSAAKSLVQLTQMRIWGCGNIIEVVGNHGDVTEDEIIFPKLKSLSLKFLPSLTSFCSWNVTLQFPSLEELIVDNCPQMKIFSRRVLTTQTLRKFEIGNDSIELHPDIDINKAINSMKKWYVLIH